MEIKGIIARWASKKSKKVADRRQRRAEERRAQILQAAMRVFEAKGYERATTKEIAAEADVSEGVLYYYFESKRDLLIHLAQAYNESIIAEIEELKTIADVKEFMRRIWLNRFSDIETRRQFFNAVMHETRLDPELWREYHDTVLTRIIAYIEEKLSEAVAEGSFRPIHAGIVARVMIAMFTGLFSFKLFEDPSLADVPTEEFVDEMVSLLLDGLRPREESRLTHPG
jgi:AcrR family transcriptional regulator